MNRTTTGRTGPGTRWAGPGEQAWDWSQVLAPAAGLVDVVLDLMTAVGAAAWGGLTGAGSATRAAWVADRPRRLLVRRVRRRRWWRRRGWWRLAVSAEVVAVAGWIGARAAWRAVRSTPTGAAAGARNGWTQARTTGRRDRTHNTSTRTGAGAGWAGPGTSRARASAGAGAGRAGPGRAGRSRTGPSWPGASRAGAGASRAEDGPVIVTATVTDLPRRPSTTGSRPAPRPTSATAGPPGPPGPRVVPGQVVAGAGSSASTGAGSGPVASGLVRSRRVDGRPETASDTRSFDLREAGYRGWIDQDGYAVAAGRRLSQAEVAEWIAAGRIGDWSHVPATAGRPEPGPHLVVVTDPTPDHQGPAPDSPDPDPATGAGTGLPDRAAATGDGVSTTPSAQPAQEEPMTTMSPSTASAAGSASTSLGGELPSVPALLTEVTHVKALAERAAAVQAQIRGWARGLGDAVTAAPWSTRPVSAAADGIGEHTSTEDLRQRITVLDRALDGADQIGEAVGSVGARGSVQALGNQ